MELSHDKPGASVFSKKSRRLLLQSSYVEKSRYSAGKQSAVSRDFGRIQETKDLKRRRKLAVGNGGSSVGESRKGRNKKEVFLSSFSDCNKNADDDSRLKPNGSVSGEGKQENNSNASDPLVKWSHLNGSSQKSENNRTIRASDPGNTNQITNNILIPKRPRCISRRKKNEISVTGTNAAGNSTCKPKGAHEIQGSTLSDDPVTPISLSAERKRKKLNDFVEDGSNIGCPDSNFKNENGIPVRISRRKIHGRRSHDSALKCRGNAENEAHLNEDDRKFYEEFLDDDEGNLEQNAAMMLSSRFSPGCTRFSDDNMTPSRPANGSVLKMASVDAAGRVLRPRKQTGKDFIKKRRHFYEVFSSDIDPYWVVKQRIRIFWPLDKSWYFGVVKEYDPVTELHLIKYDGREEEWINLQNERFKLLLFPSEIASTYGKRNSGLEMKMKNEGSNINAIDDSCEGSIMESVPIISWLACSIQRMRSAPHRTHKKKQKTLHKGSEQKILSMSEVCKPVSHTNMVPTIPFSRSTAPERPSNGNIHQVSPLLSKDYSKSRDISFVYFRKRSRKMGLALDKKVRGNSVSTSSTDPFSLKGSVFDRELPLEELLVAFKPTEFTRVTLELQISIKGIYHSAFATESNWLCRQNFLSNHCKLMLIWPIVHMEMTFVSKVLALRILSVQGCLRRLVDLMCFVMGTFSQHKICSKLFEREVPTETIGIKLSSLCDGRRQFIFMMYSLQELGNSKWRCLEKKFKQHSLLMRELSIADLTHVDVKELSTEKNCLLHSLVCEDPILFSGSSEDTMEQLVLHKSFPQNMNIQSGPEKTKFSQVDEHLHDSEGQISQSASRMDQKMNDNDVWSPTTTDLLSIWNDNSPSLASPRSGTCLKLWPESFFQNGFVVASKKPRTRVSYLSQDGFQHRGSSQQIHHRKRQFCKKIKINSAEKLPCGSEDPASYLESLACSANVLVTLGDRCWREPGALVALDSHDQKDWWISVKLSGITKYVHKAYQFLQPGISNRFTHAMMWKGGKEWMLEFSDRTQWSQFKIIHEQCYNRNLRAASLKNIPIPGVRLIDDADEVIAEVPFTCNPLNYHLQDGTEVDRALDPSHVLYDMDSDDEELTKNINSSSDAEITDDMFERAMDMFEKVAYLKNCDQFTTAELEELMVEFGPMGIIKAIYDHWRQKRQKKGLPLIRQLQPALWENYQKQLRDWELGTTKIQGSSDLGLERTCPVEKPPMFAFCLRPRGLEVPNKGSKQRSHKKFMFTNHHCSTAREPDALYVFAQKSNDLQAGGEKGLLSVSNHELSYSPRFNQYSSSFSPRDSPRIGMISATANRSYRSWHRKVKNDAEYSTLLSPRNSSFLSYSYDGKQENNRARWSNDSSDWPDTKKSQPHGLQSRRADINEFRLRDAASAAQHASNMAKLKREKAQWLLHKADLALDKAVYALMIAEAIEASEKDVVCNGLS
ncbi:uncharacterized protein [Typha angustifolia]|uniref:uncharacterized protein isoform X1 n=1 Tax=Typha angustifolia TaxID=59011 RepID=UPI003C2CF55C